MPKFPDHVQLSNLSIIEELYGRYLKNPEDVDVSWRHFFEGIDFGAYLFQKGSSSNASDIGDLRVYELIQAYRRYGHLAAGFNPLKQERQEVEELSLEKFGFSEGGLDRVVPTFGILREKEAPLREILKALKSRYVATIGFEFMDLGNPKLEKWIEQRIEGSKEELSPEEKRLLLECLYKSEIFETFLHTKYVGQTRFSLEGAETMIPLLAGLIDRGVDLGVEEFFIGMAHRGRLNVLTNILNKPYEMILEEFEDDTALSFSGNDDVRYHMGYVGEWKKKAKISMAANPSHLESVDPVLIGQVYATQVFQKNGEKGKVAPIMIHGDASLAGQGVVYETLQLMNLPSYSVGGTIHLVVNNQIGYTTLPEEGRSTHYCTDIAKTFGSPVFHVNAEDPVSALFIAKLAIEIRQVFKIDVFIDLLCYRKYGHNEGDEPSYTQPLQYQAIRAKKTIRQIYVEELMKKGELDQKLSDDLELQYKEALKNSLAKVQQKVPKESFKKIENFEVVRTAISESALQESLSTFCKVPEGFHLHPKLQKWLSDRANSLSKAIDWATGECLAIGSLLKEGVAVRLAGQDSQRGTFSQRHMVWVDTETGVAYSPYKKEKGIFEIVNSPLSEYASMGFEVGYSWVKPDALCLWEAQYGDFDNGAQIIIDQYLTSGEQKWSSISSLTLLLPHGYEGAGPEHSSARMERFLQLAAIQNIQVANPTTPAQYFHLLRRQAKQKVKKPLIVFTPKSLLRNPLCTSKKSDFITGQFEEILGPSPQLKNVKRLLLCTGKIFYDLMGALKTEDVAIVRIEQLYPLDFKKLEKLIAGYGAPVFWVQEEPENMGAWHYMQSHLPILKYIGRSENATTATGSSLKHKQEQSQLLKQALGLS